MDVCVCRALPPAAGQSRSWWPRVALSGKAASKGDGTVWAVLVVFPVKRAQGFILILF